ncbi:MAG: excinuclease ABC subunit UvrC [Thiohalomonadales bacterium]
MAEEGTDLQEFDAKAFVAALPHKPGVYRMKNAAGEVIYVGKASSLRSRVGSYFNRNEPSIKTRAMVSKITAIETTITHSEKEALLLENNLIKALKPRYNIVLRDDKSYPYIYLNSQHPYPRLSFHRGAKSSKGRYFGPYPSAGSVRQTLNILQKLFLIRPCEDNFFKHRTRPCLQYQIKRCSAPCTGLIESDHYAVDMRLATLFLEGKNQQILDELGNKMEQSAQRQAYEEAAVIRDQIQSLRLIQEQQYVSTERGDLDIIAAVTEGASSCVQLFFIRSGRNLGNKVFYPKQASSADVSEVLAAFVTQYYLTESSVRVLPDEILVNHALHEVDLLQQVLSEKRGKKLLIRHSVRQERAQWVKLAESNAKMSLAGHLANKTNLLARFESLQDALRLEAIPQRLECFDISHTMGEATVASCVVMEKDGFVKSDFRRFNITDITPGDDYAAMRQALKRRYTRIQKGEGQLPDVLLIDGGPGQTHEAIKVFEELQIEGVIIVGVAKGPGRKPGLETLHLHGINGIGDNVVGRASSICKLPEQSAALHLIQQVRDEAHRFAITAHRNRRAKNRGSSLEKITGLGPKRRKSLLLRFGGLQEITRASIDELSKVNGINKPLAEKIYAYFHESES